jgi:hypothetical protein
MATDITIATAENIISQPCAKEDIELNLRRMFSVLTSKYSRQMYDRHIAIFNRLCRFYRSIRETEIGIDKQTPGYQESLIFTFNGKNESDTICQLMIEGFQRAIEGGGLPLAAALTDLISIIW